MELGTLTKLYYSIGEVSELFGVAPSVIRYWESEFPHLKPGKNNKGERKFTQKDIIILQQIYHLVKEKGFTIEGARREMDHEKQETREKTELLGRLKALKLKLEGLRDSL
mgnify:CR=1 FL=1|jgi:DNA-binding transcriptional MerR regulator